MQLDDFLDAFNLIDRVEGLIFGAATYLPHRDLRGRWRVNGGLYEIHTARHAGSTGGDAERWLARYSIPVHGRRVTGNEYIFVVPARQARWAEYVLGRAGIPFAPGHQFVDQRNPAWVARHVAPVPAWADRKNLPAGGGNITGGDA